MEQSCDSGWNCFPCTDRGERIEPCVKNWKKPITIARHAYGDVYKGTEMKIPGAGKAELVYTAEDGTQQKELIHEFDGPGIIQGCIISVNQSQVLQEAALIMLWIQNRISGLQQKIRFLRNMTIHSKIFSRRFMTQSMMKKFKKQDCVLLYFDR